ncbi:MAG: hypothetical protein VX498_10765 [Myxococcota bacterium]|nr:hypothetical protein [Myxococcota bacterium]
MTASEPLKNDPWPWLVLPVVLAVLPWLMLIDAPMMVDERVMTYEARKWIGMDPLSPWTQPVGGSGTWRPLLVYLYWLDAGLSVPLRHALQLVLHAAFVALAWVWLRGLMRPRAALVAACFLALHPAHVATAGWIGGRADLAMGLCAVAALVAAQRERWWSCALAAGAALLFKETGLALLPVLVLLHGPKRELLPAALLSSTVFLLSFSLADPAPGYLPTVAGLLAGLLAGLALFWETLVPWFHPVGMLHLPRDQAGALLALVPLGTALLIGFRTAEGRRALGFLALALLPVLHVLPNDGGQWYLLLPSLGAAWLWGRILDSSHALKWAWIGLLLTGMAAVWEARAWDRAADRVAEIIAVGEDPGPQRPLDWPHRGPSFCCGLPYQVINEAPRGWGPIDETALKPAPAPRGRERE